MQRIFERSFVAFLLLSACAHDPRGCFGTATAVVTKSSAGPVAVRIATLELFDDGCVRYVTGRTAKCACDRSGAQSTGLSLKSFDDAVAAMTVAPNTMSDFESISLRRGGRVVQRALEEMPAIARDWLAAEDARLQPLVGPAYIPFVATHRAVEGKR